MTVADLCEARGRGPFLSETAIPHGPMTEGAPPPRPRHAGGWRPLRMLAPLAPERVAAGSAWRKTGGAIWATRPRTCPSTGFIRHVLAFMRCWSMLLDGPPYRRYHGVASMGVRPMFGVNTPNLETFLFDFKGDLYGARLSVALVDHLRDEVAYAGVDKLISQNECRQPSGAGNPERAFRRYFRR